METLIAKNKQKLLAKFAECDNVLGYVNCSLNVESV